MNSQSKNLLMRKNKSYYLFIFRFNKTTTVSNSR